MKILLFANTDWYLYNFRLALAEALRARGDQVVLVSPEGAYAPRLQELGFRWVCFPLKRRGLNPLDEVWTLVRLFKLYRRENPDLVHQFTVKCVLYGSLVCHLLGIRQVVNSVTGLGYVFTEGDGARSWLRGLIKVFYRLILRRTWVIFQNPADEALFLKNRLVERGRVALIQGSGVNIRLFSPQPEPDGPPLAILPARLLWDKGVGEFVEAARRLKTEGLRARFALVGDSDPDNPAGVPAAQVKLWEKEGMVEWWGWRSDMAAVYAQAHIVCLPSYREGMSKTLIEAAACGRPIITCNVPGCREVVQPGISGLLVPPRNALALAEAMKRLIQNPNERKSMGAFGRKIAEDQFSMELVLSQTLAFYECIRSSQREAEL
ncbi:MAG: glycosyltransferase family 4 protein [Chloroflexi bacterium]|nr:glycosyltransferase family 4 protein [Chloroflexota bacterium]